MPPEARRILLSDATSYKAVVLARFVKRHYPAVELQTCDPRPASRALHTRFSNRHFVLRNAPPDPGFGDELLSLVRQSQIDLLLPSHSGEMDVLMPMKEQFAGALGYWGDLEAYRTLHSKDRLHSLATACGVAVPARFLEPEAVKLPAVAKPLTLSSAKGVRYLRRDADVLRLARESPGFRDLMVQEQVEGMGIGYSVFARAGATIVGYGHRRLAEFPTSGGSSVYRQHDDDPRPREVAERLIAATRWSGFAMFEFKRTAAGDLFLIEANPRIWGSIHQPLADGLNLLEPLLGPAALQQRFSTRTYLPPLVYVSLALAAAGGRGGPLAGFLRHWRSNRADLALLDDPGGYLGALLRIR